VQVSFENINQLAFKIRQKLKNRVILSISGPLGVGKTTLIKAILPEYKIASPSFLHAIHHDQFVHIDAYTLPSRESFFSLGIEDLLENHCLIVEWGELFQSEMLFFDAIIINLKMKYSKNDQIREIEFDDEFFLES
jgi:tRNA threonylcarbamoyl adenosine modification protein YjeE